MRRHKTLLAAAAALGLLLILLLQPDLAKNLKAYLWSSNLEQTAAFLRNKGWAEVAFSMALIVFTTLLPVVPFAIIAGANALVYGVVPGFLISWFSAVLGAATAYWLARIWGRDFFTRLLAKYSVVQKFQTNRNAFRLIFILRLIPIFPSSVVNYGVGISPIGFGAFFWASLLGKIPVIAWESIIGYDLFNPTKSLTRVILLLFFTAVFLLLVWKFQSKVVS